MKELQGLKDLTIHDVQPGGGFFIGEGGPLFAISLPGLL
jgi:hypothetical protein